MYTKKITFSREFLSGPLAGLSVRGIEIRTTADAAHAHMMGLQRFSRRNPGTEAGTGVLYWNYNVGCEDIAPAGEPAAEVA